MQLPPKSLTETLAANMRSILDRDTPPKADKPISARQWAQARSLSEKNVQRILKGAHATTIKTLAEIAEKAELQPWHLLVPNLDPSNPPVGTFSEAEKKLYREIQEKVIEAKALGSNL